MDSARSTPFRGWWMVAIGFLTQALAVGVTMGSFPVFLVPVSEAFGASLMEVSLGVSILMAVTTLSGVVVGPILDRRSIRWVMTVGALWMALCLAGMARAQSLPALGLLFGVGMALGLTMLGPLASATLAAKWFSRRLGRAQGVTNMGGPAGAGLFSILSGVLIGEIGWRGTLWVYAGLVAAVIPAIALVVRDRPEVVGQWPDGEPPAAAAPVSDAPAAWSLSGLARASRFWLLVLPSGLLMGIATGWASQIVSLGVDLGFSNSAAAGVFGLSALLGLLGTLGFGTLADRVAGRSLLWVLMGMHCLGFALLAAAPAQALYAGVVATLGLAGGGMMPVYTSLIGRIFGQGSFGQVMGLGGFAMAPFAVIAPALGGGLRDQTGTYTASLLVFAAGLTLAALLLAGLKVGARAPRERAQPAAT